MSLKAAGRRVATYVAAGTLIATAFSAYLLVVMSDKTGVAADGLGVSLSVAVIGYYAAGVVGGALVGLLQPMARTTLGACVVGSVAGVLILAFFGLAATPRADWGRYLWWYVGFGAFGGAYSGFLAKHVMRRIKGYE